jgi:hypothetical protein
LTPRRFIIMIAAGTPVAYPKRTFTSEEGKGGDTCYNRVTERYGMDLTMTTSSSIRTN